ncbi:MAG: hypothetical protein JXA14_11530 [Anaerolineae bacterium]|nr:hypothetical protein [Anaerolineae bacterium]
MRKLHVTFRGLVGLGWRVAVIGLLVAMVTTGCGGTQATQVLTVPTAEPTEITVAFDGDHCAYHGPERMPAGRILVTLDVEDQTAYESYGVQSLTMDEGHTLEELRTHTDEGNFPLWAHDHGFIVAAQGTAEERTIILFEGPLFLACYTNNAEETQPAAAGMIGPIEIEP